MELQDGNICFCILVIIIMHFF